MASFKYGRTILKNLFSKPSTLMYPARPRQWQERTRGRVEIEPGLCILCGICSKKCPARAIAVDREGRTFSIERMSCVHCGYCVEVCPKDALRMEQNYTAPSDVKILDTVDIPEHEPKKDV